MHSLKDKLLVLMLGVIASLILLEISLRILGAIHSHYAIADRVFKNSEKKSVILCLGDSFTFGFGANREKSYPKQLKKLFEKEKRWKTTKVINRGKGATNTTTILNSLDAQLLQIKPDIVVLLAGGANSWNAYGYKDYLGRKKTGSPYLDFLLNLKITRLIKLLRLDAAKTALEKNKDITEDNRKHNEISLLLDKAQQLESEGYYTGALMIHKKIISENPACIPSYYSIARLNMRLGNLEEARRTIENAIELDPNLTKFYIFYAQYSEQDPALIKKTIDFLKKYREFNPVVDDLVAKLSDKDRYQKELMHWIESDITKIIQICRKAGIKLVLQNYPDYGNQGELQQINEVLKSVAQRYSVPFVDNNSIFRQIFENGVNKSDYFASDKSHCNAKGYKIMAENVYDCIIKNGLLK